MLSRGKLVQDWRRRLATAEADGAEGERRTWLAQMRLRLYRFLLSCYGDTAWRADEPSEIGDETLADVAHGDTTMLLDVRLDGKPAKTSGKMQAVLKSVSAAQDHPAAGPLIGGISKDEWVVAVSVRDKLNMDTCCRLLQRLGILAVNTGREIKVRHCDLEQATELIRKAQPALKIKLVYLPFPFMIVRPNPNVFLTTRLIIACLYLGPIYAFGIWLGLTGLYSLTGNGEGSHWYLVVFGLISYLLGASLAALQVYRVHKDWLAKQLQEAETEVAYRQARDSQ
ncbi:MAG: hypothetical protein K8R36_01725 [Planctomycetales bacterium]|nr:hypothetical protein [Planctomycetales bacterium]